MTRPRSIEGRRQGWGRSPIGLPPQSILIVDDDESVRSLLARLLVSDGYDIRMAGSGEEALDAIRAHAPDLVFLDYELPGRTGLEVLAELRTAFETKLLPIIMVTGAGTTDLKLRAIERGVTDFVAKPFDPAEIRARTRSLLSLKLHTDALEDAEKVIILLAEAIDARDPYTAGHSERTARYALALGRRIGLSEADLETLRKGSLFHDIGKIVIPDDVLFKTSDLTTEEFGEIRRHPGEGRKLIHSIRTLGAAVPIVYHHHERCDGSGYPEGLLGESIPLLSRITAIADVFDALTTTRTYRKALSRDRAIEIMQDEVKRGSWDPRLFEEFRNVVAGLREGKGAVPQKSC